MDFAPDLAPDCVPDCVPELALGFALAFTPLRRAARCGLPYWLLLLLALPGGAAHAGPDFSAALHRARDEAGIDPAAAQAQLQGLRAQALAAGQVAARLEADEIECRLLTDTNLSEALAVASGGLRAASAAALLGQSLPPAAELPWARLRVCAAGTMLDSGNATGGTAELDAVLAATAQRPDLASARALALIERGSRRSRAGRMVEGQDDLIEACRSLQALAEPRDTELCLGHLANHYKRMGDRAEARVLLTQLRDTARERGARFDVSVHAFSLAQVDAEDGARESALASFLESLRIAQAMHDTQGAALAEIGAGMILFQLGRPAESLPYAQRALALSEATTERVQVIRAHLLLAKCQAALGRAAEAVEGVRRVEAETRALANETLLAEWLDAQAQAQAAAGNWKTAFEAAAKRRVIDERVQAQRVSEQSARLRVRFNRDKDASELRALQRANEQGAQLRQVQALALALFVGLLTVAVAYGYRKFRQARSLNVLAMADELTGLPNRRAVLAHADTLLREARRRGERLGVLMIDVDRFKAVNDAHGHAVGDEVLRHLAQVLAGSLRSRDRLGRLGGEEFMAVLPDVQPGTATAIAERMRLGMTSAPCRSSVGELAVTVSIGVAEFDAASGAGPQTLARLMAEADSALYAAKASGRNRVALAEAAEASAG